MLNDEWTLKDELGYENIVETLITTIDTVQPPFTLGIYGGWGSGKTSIMKQVYYKVGGKTKSYLLPFTSEPEPEAMNPETQKLIKQLSRKNRGYEAVWFNPWKHEMESNPLLGLLHEIRDHFDLSKKIGNEALKLADVTVRTGLDILSSTINKITKIEIKASTIEAHGEKYEQNNFEATSSTQNFRIIFESSINKLLNKNTNKKLIIFIDDLDRCTDSKIIKLLEGIKLYLSVSNCIFIFGMDKNNVSRALKKDGINNDYLDKLFQSVVRIPISKNYDKFISDTIVKKYFKDNVTTIQKRKEFSKLLTEILEKNPRKIKNFMNSMKFHWDIRSKNLNLDINIFALFHYLRMYYEEIFEILERDNSKIDSLYSVCKGNNNNKDLDSFFSEKLKNIITNEAPRSENPEDENEVLLEKLTNEDFISIKETTLKFETIENFKKHFASKCDNLSNINAYLGVIE